MAKTRQIKVLLTYFGQIIFLPPSLHNDSNIIKSVMNLKKKSFFLPNIEV